MDYYNSNQEIERKGDNAEKWELMKRFIYDPTTKKVFDQDLPYWRNVLVFYTLFYSSLLAFFIVLLAMSLLVIDEIQPYQKGMDIPLQFNPGLTMRPAADFESTLIRFEQGKPQSYKPFADHIQTFLEQYENKAQDGENFQDCSDGRPPNSLDKVCRFDVDLLGDDCTWQKDYGYDEGQPCFLFKLNRIYGYLPEPYSIDDAPAQMAGRAHQDYVGISCEGEYAADIENIGNITYQPSAGFPKFFYPFLNQEGFRSPLVMVKFMNPSNGVVINVICKAWAKNIRHDRNELAGLYRFQLLVD